MRGNNSWGLSALADRVAAKIAGTGEDDLLEPLNRRRGDRSLDPLTAPKHLPGGGDSKGVGAKVAVEDGHGYLHSVVRRIGIGVPVGDDHSAVGIDLGHRSEGKRVERRAP